MTEQDIIDLGWTLLNGPLPSSEKIAFKEFPDGRQESMLISALIATLEA